MGLYKAQFISMVIMIALGIGVFVGFNMEWVSIENNMSRFFTETGYADYRIVSEKGEKIPRDTPYAMLVESTAPVVAQYSRLDTSAVEMALMTTIAYPVE